MSSRGRVHRIIRRRMEARGQAGFALLAGLTVWVGVCGVTMIALLNMTFTSITISQRQSTDATQRRAADAAMESAVNQIVTDPTGRIAAYDPVGTRGCVEGVGSDGDELRYVDDRGTEVRVVAACEPVLGTDTAHRVELTALVTDGAGGERVRGRAVLRLAGDRSAGVPVDLVVEHWTLRDEDPGVTPPTSSTTTSTTTTPPTTTPPTTTTTSTTTTPPTTTTTSPTSVVWSMTTTADWWWGYCVNVQVTNPTRRPIEWKIEVPVEGRIAVAWNARFDLRQGTATVTGEDWNRVLDPGGSTGFGWCAIR